MYTLDTIKNHEHIDLNYDKEKELGECHRDRKKQGVVIKIKKNNKNGWGLSKKQKATDDAIERKFKERLAKKAIE